MSHPESGLEVVAEAYNHRSRDSVQVTVINIRQIGRLRDGDKLVRQSDAERAIQMKHEAHRKTWRQLEQVTWVEPTPIVDALSFVQPVPDHCDRIIWRERYYHLPLYAAPIAQTATQYPIRVATHIDQFAEGVFVWYDEAALPGGAECNLVAAKQALHKYGESLKEIPQ